MKSLSTTQDLVLRLIGAAGQWNSFNGPFIESGLRSNHPLWRAAWLTRAAQPLRPGKPPSIRNRVDLIPLRDLPHGAFNCDLLFILVEQGQQDALERLAETWQIDEGSWLDAETAFDAMGSGLRRNSEWKAGDKRVILQLWWD